MRFRRLASATLVAVLVAFVGATASAQFGSLLKKGPKPPSVPGTKTEVAPDKKTLDYAQIDEALIEKAVKASQSAKAVFDDEVAKANAKKAQADAKKAEADGVRTKCAQGTVNAMMENAECKDKFKEKDPRTKEIQRLEDQIAAADEKGDEKTSDALKKKADPLSDALEIAADRACGGKGSAALHDCIERKTAELSKQGLAGPMLQIQAQGACMSDPSTSGIAGANACGAADPLDDQYRQLMGEYQELMKNASSKADEAMKRDMGLDDQQYARFIECLIGVRNGDPAITSQTPPKTQAAIKKHQAELDQVVH